MGRKTLRALAMASVSLLAVPAAHAKGVTVLAPTTPQGGTIKPLYGNISPFYGNIGAFYGNISPFYGNISAFYGTISPFYGNISPFYGNIGAFSGQVDPFWGNIGAFTTGLGANAATAPDWSGLNSYWSNVGTQWTSISNAWAPLGAYSGAAKNQYAGIASQLGTLYTNAQAFWGASVQARTGKSFADGFANPLFARYGFNITDPSTLAGISADQRARFIMDWYDGLMEFTGTDHVDHWMSEVNWTPALTQIQGSGKDAIIGLLDFTVQNASDIQDNIVKSGGVSSFSQGHGAAVASLMVSAHDGTGVMGIAPNASVIAYNPFDSTATASWADVTNGMVMLTKNNAHVINGSLGVSGYTLAPDWNTVLKNPGLKDANKDTVLVLAAGNDGSSQTANIAWAPDNIPILVVGSVDPNLNISTFSNRPGTACLTDDKGKCNGDYLMNHFITASGETILVSNDANSFTRMSGTSFAAPLVSGAVALLQDRWPWLAQHPKDTTYVILKSAKDLGAPGVDPVYGVGLLDVTASQSPLSYNNLTWQQYVNGKLSGTDVKTLRDPNQQATWEAKGVYVTAIEKLVESNRDFAIPLSSKLMGQTATTAMGAQEQLQSYLTSSFMTWAGATPTASATPSTMSTSSFANAGKAQAFLDFRDGGKVSVNKVMGLNFSTTMQALAPQQGWRSSSQTPYATHFALTTDDGASGVKFGFGEGASRLGGSSGLGLHNDYDPLKGGANPLLGFASGGSYGSVNLGVAPRLQLSAGVTSRDGRRDLDSLSRGDRLAALAVGDYKAVASRVGVTWRLTDAVQLNGGMTRLHENSALLGVQSTDRGDLSHGSTTRGYDFGADIAAGHGLTLSASATLGRTQQTDPGAQSLAVVDAVQTSSYEVAVTKTGLFGADRLRLSLSQPMHIEGGTMSYTGVQVVNRDTGELGQVTQTFGVAQAQRPYVAEFLYGRPVFGGAGELGLFGRAETRGQDLQGHTAPVFMGGARFRVGF